jgi:altronate hydrolase
MGSKKRVMVIHEKDNVAIALKPLNVDTVVSVEIKSHIEEIRLLSNIPIGHKVALKDMGEGEAIIKYGEPIGQSTVRISRGEHVHVHNVISQPR